MAMLQLAVTAPATRFRTSALFRRRDWSSRRAYPAAALPAAERPSLAPYGARHIVLVVETISDDTGAIDARSLRRVAD